MGGSSLFFAGRADEVVSVEHDPEWFDEVRREMVRRQISHWRGLLHEPEPAAPHAAPHADSSAPPEPSASTDLPGAPQSAPPDPAGWDPPVSDDARYAGRTFHRYAGAIDEFPDGHFDLIVVDGRARPACLAHARGKLASGGLLVVDNAERPYYSRALGLWREAGWQCRSYSGPGPYVGQFWTTQIWSRPPSGQSGSQGGR